jgi:hypothetical protein
MYYGALGLGAKDERASVEGSHAGSEYQMQPAEAGSSVIQGDDTPDVSQYVYRRADIVRELHFIGSPGMPPSSPAGEGRRRARRELEGAS